MTDRSFTSQPYDVIIAGSGPAGCSAAYFLSQAGQRVLILEKEENLPRYKACGGGLSPRFLREQFALPFDTVAIDPVAAISYIYNHHISTIPLSPGAVGMVMRADLDCYLQEHCGAEVLRGSAVSAVRELDGRVEVETRDGRCFAARYLIGADGANSAVARAVGLRRGRILAAALEAEVCVPPEVARRFAGQMVFIFGEIHYGYLWIFAKNDHFSVGIGALHPRPGELQKTLRKVMASYGISIEGTEIHGHPIPIYARRERISTARTLLAGDAAGLADPLSGEGIRFAIKSGRVAAEAVLSGNPGRYPVLLKRTIGLSHSVTILISLTFYYLQRFCLFFGAANPFNTAGVVDMLADRMSAARFFLLGVLSFPLYALVESCTHLLGLLGFGRQAEILRRRVYPPDLLLAPASPKRIITALHPDCGSNKVL